MKTLRANEKDIVKVLTILDDESNRCVRGIQRDFSGLGSNIWKVSFKMGRKDWKNAKTKLNELALIGK